MAKKPQIEKFRETARALEANESESAFDAALGKVARAKVPTSKQMRDIARALGQNDPNENLGRKPPKK